VVRVLLAPFEVRLRREVEDELRLEPPHRPLDCTVVADIKEADVAAWDEVRRDDGVPRLQECWQDGAAEHATAACDQDVHVPSMKG
jgi:hypothetical protein